MIPRPVEMKTRFFSFLRVPNLLPNSTIWSPSWTPTPSLILFADDYQFLNIRGKDGRDGMVQGTAVGSVSVDNADRASTSADGVMWKRMGMGAY